MRHVSSLRPLDESKWLGFEEKLMSNSSNIAGNPDTSLMREAGGNR
jgi:hypothetical protein